MYTYIYIHIYYNNIIYCIYYIYVYIYIYRIYIHISRRDLQLLQALSEHTGKKIADKTRTLYDFDSILILSGTQFSFFTGTKVQILTVYDLPQSLLPQRMRLTLQTSRPLTAARYRYTHFNCITGTKVQILHAHDITDARTSDSRAVLYSVYLLCWYKSTNTDAARRLSAHKSPLDPRHENGAKKGRVPEIFCF